MTYALAFDIGFGLQSIVHNFVSGLILLFERPSKVGDNIELDNQRVEIKKIGLHATLAQPRIELYQEIDRKFRSFVIRIPFPQQDLHMHVVDQSTPPAQEKSKTNKPY